MDYTQEKNTPLMQQYFDIKAQFASTLLFFQVGDFYELFFDDAKVAASYLAITLTKRGKNKGEDVPLCGIPVHALDHYLTKLIKGGFRVALCEQLTKPQPGTVVQRGVTKVFTPATLTDTTMLDEKSASYLLSFFPGKTEWGLVFGELLTAQLFATTIPVEATRQLEAELVRFFPDEIILPNIPGLAPINSYFKKMGYCTAISDQAGPDVSTAWIRAQFGEKIQPVLERHQVLENNLSSLYGYLKKNQEKALDQFKTVQFYAPDDYLLLDGSTQKNLEIVKNAHDNSTRNSLFYILDQAKTPMGSRTIKKWLLRPLVQKSAIVQRQELVGTLCTQVDFLMQLETLLSKLSDIERIIGRIALKRALLQDYLALQASLEVMPDIKNILEQLTVPLAKALSQKIADFGALVELLACSLNPDLGATHFIKKSFDHQLDRIYDLLENGQQEFLKLEQQEVARTGINSLKVGFNNISGYYIEITNTHHEKIPVEYIHQQTLASRKRFVTPALKELEREFFKAQQERESVEQAVFERIKKEVLSYLHPLRQCAQSVAYLDALFGFATAAYENSYVAPQFNDKHDIIIKAGRHPVVEKTSMDSFTPNDTQLTQEQATWIITGPNMGGKSTYLRQVALICLMAQCGSFVPAESADLPILDRVFTRIGSGDNVAEGKSTFLVEMEETATICTQATKHSLVILDEVGRGTSTYDGIALAQAILEHIHQNIKARCLFATHYHELTQLETVLPGIINYHTSCKKINDTIIFLHKIMRGIAEGSFGLNVAKLADLPDSIIKRASTILNHIGNQIQTSPSQQSLLSLSENLAVNQALSKKCDHESIINKLASIDCANLTPKQALDILWELTEKTD